MAERMALVRKGTVRQCRIRGVLAVLAVDAFTGKPILSKDFAVEMEGEGAPVRKRDGFFVFFRRITGEERNGGMPSKEADAVTLTLAGRGYRERVVHVQTAGLRAEDPVITVRVYPDRDYLFPADTVCMEGVLPAESSLRAALLQETGGFRLAQDYHNGKERITLYGSGKCNAADGFFFLCAAVPDVRSLRGEFCLLGERAQGVDERYFLRVPLSQDYARREARLYPACMQEASERTEHYFFAFPAVTGSAGVEVFCLIETPKGVREYRLPVRCGETKRMDFFV